MSTKNVTPGRRTTTYTAVIQYAIMMMILLAIVIGMVTWTVSPKSEKINAVKCEQYRECTVCVDECCITVITSDGETHVIARQ